MNKYQNNLELHLKNNCDLQTVGHHRYTTYPLRLSRVFRLDGINSNRAYFYSMNTSPGLLAGDELNISLLLETNSNLYLTDQAATKVHPMPDGESKATVNYQIEVRPQANLELVPEPIILYTDAALNQNTAIKLDCEAKLFLTEIVLPGRLARGESYQFRYYLNRLKVSDLTGKLLFKDAMYLEGKTNLFKDSKLFTPLPIMGSAIAIYPNLNLDKLNTQIESIQMDNFPKLMVATSILPSDRGLLIRAFASKTIQLKRYFHLILQSIRNLTQDSDLPYIPK
ncbi:MAG: urease accessory protein UreD [Pleurocapsa sp.]